MRLCIARFRPTTSSSSGPCFALSRPVDPPSLTSPLPRPTSHSPSHPSRSPIIIRSSFHHHSIIMPTPPHWRFRAMAPSEPNQNPVQGEFFSSDLPERFIRESVQNSLDARAGRAPVRVRFTISGPTAALDPRRAQLYLAGLRPHFEAVIRAESANVGDDSDRLRDLQHRKALLDGPLPFLTVEDSGLPASGGTSAPMTFGRAATTSGASSAPSASRRRARTPAAHGGLGSGYFQMRRS